MNFSRQSSQMMNNSMNMDRPLMLGASLTRTFD